MFGEMAESGQKWFNLCYNYICIEVLRRLQYEQ